MTIPAIDQAQVAMAAADSSRSAAARARRALGTLGRFDIRVRPLVLGTLGVLTLLLAWQMAVTTEVVSPTSVPAPADVARRMVDLLTDADFRTASVDTLQTWATAMVIAIVTAIPLGLLMGTVPFLERPLGTVVHAARSVPSTALIPVAIVLFGLGIQMKAALVLYSVFWTLLLHAVYGSQSVDPMMRTVAQSLRWNWFGVMRRVVLPAAAPAITTGIRVSASVGLIVVFSAELLGASGGVGTIIVQYQQQDPPRADFVYAGIVLMGLAGWFIAASLSFIERRVVPWANANRD